MTLNHTFLATLAFLCMLPLLACAQSNSMQTELKKMYDEDQQIRKQAAALGVDIKKDTALMIKMVRFDSASTSHLKDLLGSTPWFTKESVGKEGLEAAFILVQHSPDHDFQKRCLPHIEAQAKSGDLSMQDYAMLLDRTLTDDNKPQVYGTQIQIVNGEWVPYPIEDSANVDKRRKEIGLFPMETYLELIRTYYKKQ